MCGKSPARAGLSPHIHDGSWRNRLDAKRDGRAESRETEAYLKQYVDRPSGEPARRQMRRHRACEVERPLYDPGAKKEYRNEF